MNFDFSTYANLVAEFTVRFHDGGVQVPIFTDFDFLRMVTRLSLP
jgi:hypothetical protein